MSYFQSYIFTDEESPCLNGKYETISECSSSGNTGFSKANSSVLIGFLNVFLWASNIWFLYKETAWYTDSHPSMNPTSLGA